MTQAGRRATEIWTALAVALFGAIVIAGSLTHDIGWNEDTGPGAGYFPFYIGLIVCISSLVIIYQSLFGKKRDTGTFVNRQQLKQVMSVLWPAAVYVLAIMFLGIYVASALYIALFMIVLGKYSPVKSVILGVAINAVFFMMFEVWFKVPLYKGSLEPLAFLGY